MIIAYGFEPDQLALLDNLFKWATRPENVWTPEALAIFQPIENT